MPTIAVYVTDEMMKHFYRRGKPSVIASQYLRDRVLAEDIKEIQLQDENKKR